MDISILKVIDVFKTRNIVTLRNLEGGQYNFLKGKKWDKNISHTDTYLTSS